MTKLPPIEKIQHLGQEVLVEHYAPQWKRSMGFQIVDDPALRMYFDFGLDRLHYAKSCQRVGRCMRLAIITGRQWVGGIVLGSTFPNIEVRDQALGFKDFVRNCRDRGLRNPWCAENVEYWGALQTVVNHARTFVFPQFQGRGLGKMAHKLLLTEGVELWERKYSCQVYALDTLCDSSDSGLFVSNGWTLVGMTKGFSADYSAKFTESSNTAPVINNAALKAGRVRWQVWVHIMRSSLRPNKRPILSQ